MIAKCHPNRFAQARGLCKNCYDGWLKSVNPVYKLRQQKNSDKWKAKHPEQWARIQAKRVAKVKSDPQYRRERDLIKKYHMTLIDYDNLLKAQDGSCALCYRKPGKVPLHVDHDHKTRKIRGLLCHQCNWYLGIIDKDPKIIARIITYRGHNG